MRVGVFQCAGGGLNTDQRIEQLNATLASEELDVVVCPELFMSGYNVGGQLLEKAEPSGGDIFNSLSKLEIQYGTAIVYGYPERDGDDVFNAASCIDAQGQMIANQRKFLMPPGDEQNYFTCGDELLERRHTIMSELPLAGHVCGFDPCQCCSG